MPVAKSSARFDSARTSARSRCTSINTARNADSSISISIVPSVGSDASLMDGHFINRGPTAGAAVTFNLSQNLGG